MFCLPCTAGLQDSTYGLSADGNIAAVNDILKKYRDKSVLIGTHGTALSLIINYYDNSFGLDGFMRIIDYMPYVIRMDFEGEYFAGKQELGFVKKEFHGQK